MKHVLKRVGRLKEGNFLFYYNYMNSKYLYVTKLKDTGFDILIEYVSSWDRNYNADYKVTIYPYKQRRVSKLSFTKSDKGEIFKLTDEEFLMETIGEI